MPKSKSSHILESIAIKMINTQITIDQIFKVNEVQLIYRRRPEPQYPITISSSDMASDVLRTAWDQNRIDLLEEFKILLLDNKNSCLGISHISTGGMNLCPVDPKIVFTTALKAAAKQIILAHNHPSGNLNPSQEDIGLTRRLIEAGKLLDISVVDHIILTSEGYHSFADARLMP